jgi:hypothetical protein
MFIFIDKTETIHHFSSYFVEKLTEFPEKSIESFLTLSITSLSYINVSRGSRG